MIKKWRKISKGVQYQMWKKGSNFYIGIGKNTNGKYDVWTQRGTKISKWLAGGHYKNGVSLLKAKQIVKKYKKNRR